MRSRVRLAVYKQGSKSAKALAEYLGVKRLKVVGSTFVPRQKDIVINWGNSGYLAYNTINRPEATTIASNKIKTFQALDRAGVNIPELSLHKDNCQYLLADKIVVRHTVTGHSGEGIEIIPQGEELPEAPLYTGFIRKKNEYRVIVVDGQVVDLKQKLLASDAPEDRSRYIRNLANGWIFARDNLEYVEGLNEIGIEAVKALGLDFGAVDVISDREDNLYVLEVNTAFGLEGTTIELVGEALKTMIKRIQYVSNHH